MSGEFEKKIKKLNLDPKYEQELLAMFNQGSGENPCSACAAKGTCEKNKQKDEKDDGSNSCSGCSP